MKIKYKVLITTYPFAAVDQKPLQILNNKSLKIITNSFHRKMKEREIVNIIKDIDFIIAGTENYSKKIINNAKKLKLISRVGVGLDGLDFKMLKKKKIKVTYTPDAVTPAVVDYTIGGIISLQRELFRANEKIKIGKWTRIYGRTIENSKFGIIGLGRIGKNVALKLKKLGAKDIYVNDIKYDQKFLKRHGFKKKSKDYIYKNSNVITLHVPLSEKTKNLINIRTLRKMTSNTMIINTSRGEVINEKDLYTALKNNIIKSAWIDVFEKEPYNGKLSKLENCFLTAHMGSMDYQARTNMEIEASNAVLDYINNKNLKNLVLD